MSDNLIQDGFLGPAPGSGGGPAGADVKVKVTAADTTTNFLDSKVAVVAGELTKAVLTPGANEQLELGLPSVGPGGTIGGGASFVNSVTLDANGRVTGATAAAPAGGSGAGWKPAIASDLQTKTGVATAEMSYEAYDFSNREEWLDFIGPPTPQTNKSGGVIRFLGSQGLAQPGTIVGPKAGSPRFAVYARLEWEASSPVGNFTSEVGLINGANTLSLSMAVPSTVQGGAAAGHIVCWETGLSVAIDSGIDVSAGSGIVEVWLWSDGTTVSLKVGAAAPVTRALADFTWVDALRPWILVGAGGAPINIDRLAYAFEKWT